jgi:hypothetical protein
MIEYLKKDLIMKSTDAITTISNAIKDHTKWMESINITLICDVKPSDNMLDLNAHKKCKFGQWLDENSEALKAIDLDTFLEVYNEHQALHSKAKEILDIAYDKNFMNIVKHQTIPEMKYKELLKLSKDIKGTLRNFRSNIYSS